MDHLLTPSLSELTLDALAGLLLEAGDEDSRWEAKGREVRSESVVRAVAGMANRDGGVVVLGVERTDGVAWRLTGVRPVGDEPGVWLDKVVHENLRPVPPTDLRAWALDDDRWVAVVRVAPCPGHLVVTNQGIVYRREHGQTRPVNDGSRLTRLVLERARPDETPATPTLDQEPDEFARAVRGSLERGGESTVANLLPQLRRAAEHAARTGSQPALDAALDRLASLGATALLVSADEAVSWAALRAWHELFDAGLRMDTGPRRPEIDLWRGVYVRVRALGALAVRLERWPAVRRLAEHPLPGAQGDRYPGWLSYMVAEDFKALGRPANAEHYRQPVRAAVDVATRLPALSPEGLDASGLLDSVVQFDFLSWLVELDSAERGNRRTDSWPNFAFFDGACLRPLARALVDGGAISRDLLQARTAADIARLLWVLDRHAATTMAQQGFWSGFADPHTHALMERFGRQ